MRPLTYIEADVFIVGFSTVLPYSFEGRYVKHWVREVKLFQREYSGVTSETPVTDFSVRGYPEIA